MKLNQQQRKHLRGLAHALQPVVMIGQKGNSPAVKQELDSALTSHELVKVSIRVGDRDLRDQAINELEQQTQSSLVTRIGNIAVFYRAREDKPKIVLPD
jgi:RNA-binding protein